MTPAEFFAADVWAMGLVFKSLAELDMIEMKIIPWYWNAGRKTTKDDFLIEWETTNKLKPTSTGCVMLNSLIDDMLKLRYQERPTSKMLLDRIRRIKCWNLFEVPTFERSSKVSFRWDSFTSSSLIILHSSTFAHLFASFVIRTSRARVDTGSFISRDWALDHFVVSFWYGWQGYQFM